MATYLELYELSENGLVRNRVTAAVAILARTIFNEAAPTAPRKAWAQEAILDPASKTREMIWYLLAENVSFTKDQIIAGTDAATLTGVTNAVAKRIAVS